MADSPFNITTTGKKKGISSKGVIIALVVTLFLALGVFVGVLLVRQNQNVQERAQVAGNCANPASIVQCPRPDGALVSCDTPDTNGNAQISLCNTAGRSEKCGGVDYCCPAASGSWTTDMSACTCSAAAPTALTTQDLTGTSVTLKWTKGVGASVRLWVSTNSNPVGCTLGSTSAACIASDVRLDGNLTEYVLTGLTPNTKYYWRLMSFDKEGCDSGTTVANFTTTTSTASVTTPTSTATSTPTATSTATSTATATAKATSTSTATATTTATSTATSKSTAAASATKPPIPSTGTGWATYGAVGLGVLTIIGALLLAL